MASVAVSGAAVAGAAPVARRVPRVHARAATRPAVARVVGAGLVLVAFALAQVWVRLQIVRVAYALSAARDIVARLEQEGRELEVELATLTSPRRLEDVARGRLRMTDPRPGQVVVLR
jgi:cell division protein FtsL